MSSLFVGLGGISAIVLVVTLVIVAIVKLIMYLVGKQLTTPNKRTRKLLFFEIVVTVCSFAIHIIGTLFDYALYSLSDSPTVDTISQLLKITLAISVSLLLYVKFLKAKKIQDFYLRNSLWIVVVFLPLYSVESLVNIL